jgi:replicative DNA helicase
MQQINSDEIFETLLKKTVFDESALIRSVIAGGDVIQAISIVGPDDFHDEQNRVVFETIVALNQKGAKITASAIVSNLEGHNAFASDKEIRDCLVANKTSGLPEWTKRNALSLKQRSIRLKAASVANNILAGLIGSEKENPALKIIMDARSDLNDLRLDTGLKRANASSVVDQLIHNWENPPPVFETGLPSYDKMLGGGFVSGESYCFAGANKAGKTMAAGTLSYNLGQRGVRHAYICLEMGAVQIEQRQVCINRKISTDWFANKDTRQSKQMLDHLHAYKAFVGSESAREFIDESLIRTSDIIAEMYRLKMEGFEGLIIDYFGLVHPDVGFRGTSNDHQDVLAMLITSTAKSLGLWVLCIAQLNNDGNTYGSKALMRACSHVVALEKCDDVLPKSARWLRSVSSRFTASEDMGAIDQPSFFISKNGSHIVDELGGQRDEI